MYHVNDKKSFMVGANDTFTYSMMVNGFGAWNLFLL